MLYIICALITGIFLLGLYRCTFTLRDLEESLRKSAFHSFMLSGLAIVLACSVLPRAFGAAEGPFPFIDMIASNSIVIVHEGGHFYFGFFGTFLSVAGGSLMQLGVPFGLAFRAYRNGFRRASSPFLIFLAVSFANLAPYIRDAREMALPLISSPEGMLSGQATVHDWNYLLKTMHLLPLDDYLAAVAALCSLLTFIAAIYVLFPQTEKLPAEAKEIVV